MKHELKIIMTFNTEDFDHDQATPIGNHSIRVLIDEYVIGCIQDLKFSANCKEFLPNLEVTFPDLVNLGCDMEAYNASIPSNRPRVTKLGFEKEIGYHIDRLKLAPNVIIKMEGIDDGVSQMIPLNEVGTDGDIDHFPIKRRHSI